jgi:methionine-rich copper-binding protein CopC
MPRTLFHRLAPVALAVFAIVAIAIGLPGGTASAHNTLLGSDPADGASLTTAPTQITWQFDLAVPLETMTVTLIDATGARSELSG